MIGLAFVLLLMWAPWLEPDTENESVAYGFYILGRIVAMIGCYAIAVTEMWTWIGSVLA